jgi:hypothetical protein
VQRLTALQPPQDFPRALFTKDRLVRSRSWPYFSGFQDCFPLAGVKRLLRRETVKKFMLGAPPQVVLRGGQPEGE